MPKSTLFVYREPPRQSQIRITSGVALALFLAFVATLFYMRLPLPKNDAFFPSINIFLITGDLITATLLWAQARVLRSRRLNVLGAGYFYTGLILMPRTLTFPGAVAPLGLMGANANTSIWLSVAAQAGFPIAVMAYAWLGRVAEQDLPAHPASRPALGLYVIVPVVTALLLTLLATAGGPLLPSLTTSLIRYTTASYLATSPTLLLFIAAIVVLQLGRRSELDIWLQLVLWGWFLATVIANLSSARFTVGWYVGQIISVVSSQFVLFTLIAETNTLYGHRLQQLTAEKREWEKLLLVRDAIAASIAHELRQPLSVILLDAQLAKVKAGHDPELAELLDEIAAAGLRADDVIVSTRAMFGRKASEKQPVDFRTLLRSTLDMIAGSARAQEVSVDQVFEGRLRPVRINSVQMQQALLNLFQNAIQALSRVSGRRRTLRVCCRAAKECAIIRIEDNGLGTALANREKIFAPFFTTRPEGSGLGLAIVHMVIAAHGGRISLEPRSPSGTAFVVQLPYDGGEAG